MLDTTAHKQKVPVDDPASLSETLIAELESLTRFSDSQSVRRMDPRERLKFLSRGQKQSYSNMIRSLTGFQLDETQARLDWENILTHKSLMERQLKRTVSRQVAAIDYYESVKSVVPALCLMNRETIEQTWVHLVTDHRTGLYNYRYFKEEFSRAREIHRRKEARMALFLLDIDHFKNYNDKNGHLAGDILLAELGYLIFSQTRLHIDIPCRYGGEEFVILFPFTNGSESLKLADRVRRKIATFPFPHRETQPGGKITISGGVSLFPDDGIDLESLVRVADRKLYRAKSSGRNCVY